MFRIASRIALLALPLGLGGCFVAAPYDEPYYSGPPAVVLEHPEYRPYYYVPRYRVEEHAFVPGQHWVWYGRDRDRHERHERRHDRDHDHERD